MIKLAGVTKKFGDFTALDNVDLMIPTGTSFGLLGSNGAGKSTILRLLTGIYKAESGNVTVDGDEVFDNTDIKSRVFFINDETVQFGTYTVKELKNYYKGFYPKFSEEVYQELLKTVKLPEDKRIDRFSKGMKRQAIVIIGLACCTDYLLLDEAFDGLDPTMRIIVKRMLVDAMLDRKLTTVISSHNLKEINEAATAWRCSIRARYFSTVILIPSRAISIRCRQCSTRNIPVRTLKSTVFSTMTVPRACITS